MEGNPGKREGCHSLTLDLIPKGSEWLAKRDDQRTHASSDEKKLELRLGPPGYEPIWSSSKGTPRKGMDESLLSLGCFSSMTHTNNRHQKKGTPWSCPGYQEQQQPKQFANALFLHQFQSGAGAASLAKESSQPSCTRTVEHAEKIMALSSEPVITAVPNNIFQKSAASAPVVGWPPLRSFRKNLASSSSGKTSPEPQCTATKTTANEKSAEKSCKGMFVKINMDGIPIGRKIDLHAYDSYEKLSIAVDELFIGLLAAQKDAASGGTQKVLDENGITGLLDGKGEYTLVYEDNEGDRMLVGDIPWHMFLSTAKRLRVLKSSDLPYLNWGGGKKAREEGADAM